MKHIGSFSMTALMTAVLALPAWGHGDEDHGDGDHGSEVAAAVSAGSAPRASAQSEEFELVAVLQDKQLTLYLDRYATNEPVPDAQIELESGALRAVATQFAPGAYAIPREGFAKPGKYPLTISVQAGDTGDLLTATLDLTAPVAAVEQVPSSKTWAVWGAAGAALVVGAGLVAVRRRKNNREHRE